MRGDVEDNLRGQTPLAQRETAPRQGAVQLTRGDNPDNQKRTFDVPSVSNRLPQGKRDELKQSAERLYDLGPLVLAYFLIEVSEGAGVSETLDHYLTTLTPELVCGVGADHLDATATAQRAALAYVPTSPPALVR